MCLTDEGKVLYAPIKERNAGKKINVMRNLISYFPEGRSPFGISSRLTSSLTSFRVLLERVYQKNGREVYSPVNASCFKLLFWLTFSSNFICCPVTNLCNSSSLIAFFADFSLSVCTNLFRMSFIFNSLSLLKKTNFWLNKIDFIHQVLKLEHFFSWKHQMCHYWT